MKNPFVQMALIASQVNVAVRAFRADLRKQGRSYRPTSSHIPHQGAKECARRVTFREKYPWHYQAPFKR